MLVIFWAMIGGNREERVFHAMEVFARAYTKLTQ